MKLRPLKEPPKLLPSIWKPLPKQFLALSCPADVILFGGAVGGGKTEYLLASWVSHSSAYGKYAAGIIARRTRDELAEIQKRARHYFPQLGARWVQKEKHWLFPNGATLLATYLKTDSDARRFGGHQFTWAAIDEAGEFPTSFPIDFLLSRLRHTAPIPIRTQMLLTANPGGPGHKWLYERFIKDRPAGVPFHALGENGKPQKLTSVYIPSRLTDNPYLMADASYRDRVRAAGAPWLVRALIAGDWTVSIDGKTFSREWFTDNRYSRIPEDQVLAVIQSWDMASKDEPENDRSACTTWAVTENAMYLIHAWAGRLQFPDLKTKAEDLYERFKPSLVLVEDASAGIQILQTLKRAARIPLFAVKPLGKKGARASAATLHFDASPRRVLFPERADFLDELIEELCSFPKGVHDDYVDSVVQAVHYVMKRWNLSGVAGSGLTAEVVRPEKTRAQRDDTPQSQSARFSDPRREDPVEDEDDYEDRYEQEEEVGI